MSSLPDSVQVAALNSILQRCVQIARIDPVDVCSVALDQELDNVIVTIDSRNLHPSPSVLGHIVSRLVLTQISELLKARVQIQNKNSKWLLHPTVSPSPLGPI